MKLRSKSRKPKNQKRRGRIESFYPKQVANFSCPKNSYTEFYMRPNIQVGVPPIMIKVSV